MLEEEEATARESQQANRPVEDQTVLGEGLLDDGDDEFFYDDECEDDDEFFDDDGDDEGGEECDDEGGEKPAAYRKVQGTTNDLNSIYRDGAAVAKELKGAYEDIKKLMDIRGLFKL